MKTLQFSSEPEFAELWDFCVHNLLYNKDTYVREVIDLFNSINISDKSRILDTCAGTGFISLYLREKGFDVDCADLMLDEIKVFQKRARLLGVDDSIEQLSWKNIPQKYTPSRYDLLFCRGNSFIYADGGWNKDQVVNRESSLDSYKETLRIFYKILKDGGYLYIDKFPDNEMNSNKIVAKIRVGNNEEDLIFYTERFPEKRLRKASMIRKNKHGKEIVVPNITYDLSESELEKMLSEVGFRKIQRIRLDSEKHFVTWLAQK